MSIPAKNLSDPPAASVRTFREADFPEPFRSGLEFNAPVRGPWNVVHMALLVPEAHLLYICARGCLRGVLMTAWEMKAEDRMSWIGVAEEDLAGGRLEEATFTSACEIIDDLSPRPRILFLYLSCIHKFSHFDYPHLIRSLEARYPEIHFIDCHMMPTMRKSGPTDEERTRAKMYQCLTEQPERDERCINVIGNDRPLAETSLLLRFLRDAGFTVRDITSCRTFSDFTAFAGSAWNITFSPAAVLAAEELSARCGQTMCSFLPVYQPERIADALRQISETLQIPCPGETVAETLDTLDRELRATRKLVGDRPVALDYTVTPRPLSLARLLLEYGFSLTLLFCDAFDRREEEDFLWIREHAPACTIVQTLSPKMRLSAVRERLLRDRAGIPEKTQILCLGQKAAYLTSSSRFVNHVYAGNMPDVSALLFLAEEMRRAVRKARKLRYDIQLKGLGCPSCLTDTRYPEAAWRTL